MYNYEVSGIVNMFKMKGGWFYLEVPKNIVDDLKYRAIRGMIPIESKVGNTVWNTSLMSMGDGTYFIALKREVRKKESICIGDKITVYIK